MRKQNHRQPLFDRKVRFESKDKWGNKQQREYVRQGRLSNVLRIFAGFIANLFSDRGKTLEALDLRPDPSRGHGANYLRALWPALGKMVSTRDGRPV